MAYLVTPRLDGSGVDLLQGAHVFATCQDPNEAQRLARMLEDADDDEQRGVAVQVSRVPNHLRSGPKALTFETATGVDVVVGTKTVVTCVDWPWASRIALLLESEETKKTRSLTAAFVGVPR